MAVIGSADPQTTHDTMENVNSTEIKSFAHSYLQLKKYKDFIGCKTI